MSNLYKCVNYEDLEEGEMILAFGNHAVRWDFEVMGTPAYGFVPVEPEDDWIPNRDRLPTLEDGIKKSGGTVDVLVHLFDGTVLIGNFYPKLGVWNMGDSSFDITHWKPLSRPLLEEGW